MRIAPGWLRVLLARRRFASGRPKHTLSHLRDPEEVAVCEKELEEAGKKVAKEPERYEMHYQDVRRTWRPTPTCVGCGTG